MWKSKQTSPSVVDSEEAACTKKQTNKAGGRGKSPAKFANWFTESRALSCTLKGMPFLYAWNLLYRAIHHSSSAAQMGRESELYEEPAVAWRKKLPVMQFLPIHVHTAVLPTHRWDFVLFALNFHVFFNMKKAACLYLKDAPTIQYLKERRPFN